MKKGHEAVRTMVYMVFVMIHLLLGTYILFYTIDNMDFYTKVHDNALTYNMLANRYIYSPHCLAYTDSETGHTFPGTIDGEKWIEEDIAKCISGRNDVSAQLDLRAGNIGLYFGNIDANGDVFFVSYRDSEGNEVPAYLTVRLKGFDPYDEETEVVEVDYENEDEAEDNA